MRVTGEDSEAWKKLSSDLEENHVETEERLNDETGKLCVSFLAMKNDTVTCRAKVTTV